MSGDDILRIKDLIARRRRQLLIHSIIYYRMDESLISDRQWSNWAVELEELTKKYPNIAKVAPLANEFNDFDHSTGYNLPLETPWAVARACWLVEMAHTKGFLTEKMQEYMV